MVKEGESKWHIVAMRFNGVGSALPCHPGRGMAPGA